MNKETLKRTLDGLGIPYTGEETNAVLQSMIDSVEAPPAAVPSTEPAPEVEPEEVVESDELSKDLIELGYKGAIAKVGADKVAALAKEKNEAKREILSGEFDVKLSEIRKARFVAPNRRIAGMAQAALLGSGEKTGAGNAHPHVTCEEERLKQTYVFDYFLDEIEAIVKEYKKEQTVKQEKQLALERKMKAVF